MTTLNLGKLGRLSLTRPDEGGTESDTNAMTAAEDNPVRPESETPHDDREKTTENATDPPDIGKEESVSDETGRIRFRRLRSLSRRTVVGVTAFVTFAAILGLLVAGTLLFIGNDEREDVVDSTGSMKSMVAEQVTAMLSYDYTTADNELKKAESGLTSQFRDDYRKLIDETIVPGALEQRVVTKVSIVGESVVDQTENRAELLLFLNQVTTSAAEVNPATTGSRVVVTAVRDDGRWLVDGLQPV